MSFDVSKDFKDMIAYPELHKMTNVTGTCYEASLDEDPSNNLVLKMVANVHAKQHRAQDVCAGYMFFDPVHPSILVHNELAEKVAQLLDAEGVFFR